MLVLHNEQPLPQKSAFVGDGYMLLAGMWEHTTDPFSDLSDYREKDMETGSDVAFQVGWRRDHGCRGQVEVHILVDG